jgi:hypothetical protein
MTNTFIRCIEEEEEEEEKHTRIFFVYRSNKTGKYFH